MNSKKRFKLFTKKYFFSYCLIDKTYARHNALFTTESKYLIELRFETKTSIKKRLKWRHYDSNIYVLYINIFFLTFSHSFEYKSESVDQVSMDLDAEKNMCVWRVKEIITRIIFLSLYLYISDMCTLCDVFRGKCGKN